LLRRSLLAAAIALAVSFNVSAEHAQTDVAATEAGDFLGDLGGNAIDILTRTDEPLDQRESELRDVLEDGFDLPLIGRLVLGRTWRTLSPEQKGEYVDLFSTFILQTYSRRLGGYSGEELRVVKIEAIKAPDFMVRSQISQGSGPPVSVDWRVRHKDGGYRIIDVLVEGVSMVVTQRNEFSALVQSSGFDGLLMTLRARTDRISAQEA
jgi:phospholipid transport system substrate-binding protein